MKVLVADKISEQGVRILRDAGFQVDLSYEITPEELKRVIGEYDALVVRSRTKVTKEVIASGKRLKVVGRAGVGLDNIDVEEAQKRGLKVVSTPTAPTIAVAELALGLMLALIRQIPKADTSVKSAKWLKKEFMGQQLAGRKLGVVGFGRIGRELAKSCKALSMSIIVYDVADVTEAAQELGMEVARTLPDLLKVSDVVSLHLPLLKETHHIIGDKELSMMKDGAYLINTSRGGIIDEKTLLKALDSGKLNGAGLDVFEAEPPVNSRLVQHPRTVCTPHIGAQTEEAQEAAGILVAQGVASTLGVAPTKPSRP